MNRLITALVAAAALWAASCGGGGSTIVPPLPSGGFSFSSLSGTYAFMTNGEVCAGCTVSATPLARVGSFTADGKGNISSGIYDVVSLGGVSSTVQINTGSSYTMNADGRGTLTFSITSNGAPTTINFAIVLTSGSSGTSPASDGLMMDETATGMQSSTGSGNFALQTPSQFAVSAVSGSYVFDFTGFDGNTTNGPFPESLVGEFTASAGVISSGVEDVNDDFGLITDATMTTGGSLSADPTFMATAGRGTAIIEGQPYAFYIVDANRVRFISSNGATTGPMLSGDAVFQTSPPPASPNGGFAFLVAGSDANGVGITRVGRFTAGGSMLNNMLMDVNDAASQTAFNGLQNGSLSSYDAATGRGTFTFQDSNNNSYTFVFYLSSASAGVLQEVSPSNTAGIARVVADGSVNMQSGAPFTSSNITGGYAMNWSGLVTSGGSFGNTDEEDVLGQVSVKNLSLTGTSNTFQFTSPTLTPNLNIGTAGSINFNGGDGASDDGKRVSLTVNLSNTSTIDLVVYIVSPQLAFFENSDNNGTPRVVAGLLKAQQ